MLLKTWYKGLFSNVCQNLSGGYRTFASNFALAQVRHCPGQTKEKDGSRGFSLLPFQPAVLPTSDAGNDGVEPAPCFDIQNC